MRSEAREAAPSLGLESSVASRVEARLVMVERPAQNGATVATSDHGPEAVSGVDVDPAELLLEQALEPLLRLVRFSSAV